MVDSIKTKEDPLPEIDFGKFEYDKELGVGGQGMVCLYKTKKVQDGRPSIYPDYVAIKYYKR